MLDEVTYRSHLNVAVRKTLHCLDAALQGKDSQEGAAAPFKLSASDLREVRAHASAIVNVVGAARLVPTSAKVPAERAERGYRRAAPRFT